MKLRTKNYIKRKKAINNLFHFSDLKSFLFNSFQASRSLVVKKDIVNMLIELNQPSYAKAS